MSDTPSPWQQALDQLKQDESSSAPDKAVKKESPWSTTAVPSNEIEPSELPEISESAEPSEKKGQPKKESPWSTKAAPSNKIEPSELPETSESTEQPETKGQAKKETPWSTKAIPSNKTEPSELLEISESIGQPEKKVQAKNVETNAPIHTEVEQSAPISTQEETPLDSKDATPFACPHCQQALRKTDRTWRCENNHCFDIAKQGYVNLLPSHLCNSKSPGDSAEMIQARIHWLDAGYYAAAGEALAREIKNIVPTTGWAADFGSGDGYYLQHLIQANEALRWIGLDISRDAIKQASRRIKDASHCVASSKRPPIQAQSLDVVSCCFAPIYSGDFAAVLRTGGKLITLNPAQHHLQALKDTLYSEVHDYDEEKLNEIGPEFKLINSQTIEFDCTAKTSEDLINLAVMTPHYWRAPQDKRELLKQSEPFTCQAAMIVRVFEKISDSEPNT